MENMDKGLSTKMGADRSAKNTPSPEVQGFDEKRLHQVSVVPALIQGYMSNVLKNIILIKHQTLPKTNLICQCSTIIT